MFCVRADELSKPITASKDGATLEVKVKDTVTYVTEFNLVVRSSKGFWVPEWSNGTVVIRVRRVDYRLHLEYTYSTMRQWKKYNYSRVNNWNEALRKELRLEALKMADSVYDVYRLAGEWLIQNKDGYQKTGFWVGDNYVINELHNPCAPPEDKLLIDENFKQGLFGIKLLTKEEKQALKTVQAHLDD